MKFQPPLQKAILLKRYKRFLADVRLPNGEEITVHCPNTGAMTGCAEAGSTIWLQYHSNPKRKYAYGWVLSELACAKEQNIKKPNYACIQSQMANELVAQAWGNKKIFSEYAECTREKKYGNEGSRIDFLFTGEKLNDCYVEVKSVTLRGDKLRVDIASEAQNISFDRKNTTAYFPDAVSVRGQKHIRELIAMREQGHRAVLFFCIQLSGIELFRPARFIDPQYASLLEQAKSAGVEIIAYNCQLSEQEVYINKACVVSLNDVFEQG